VRYRLMLLVVSLIGVAIFVTAAAFALIEAR
jgi:hypothetical protein